MGIGKISEYFAVNGEPIVSPQSCKVSIDPLADANSGRSDDGVMHINWIWREIRKVTLTFPPLTSEEVSELLSMVQGKEYDFTYPDPIDGTERTIHCYTSNNSSDLKSGVLYGGLWMGVSFSAIEMEGVR